MSPKREFVGRGASYALALLGLLVAGQVRAQGQGVGTLTGTVVDASTNAPIADVVVTATSPQLQGEQVAVTDSTGTYHIPQLTPGIYSLRFEKETYKPYSRGDIQLNADQLLRVNIQLLPESLVGEQVVVVGKTPVIDVGSTQSGLTITSTFSQNIPVSPANVGNQGVRSYQGLALAAPQVNGDLYGVSIAGTTSPENGYLIDGLNFGDTGYGVSNKGPMTGTTGGGSDFSVEFIDQLNVITGGYLPEYGRSTGGILSLTTKSGGNEFHGSVFGTWTPGALAQQSKTITSATSIINQSTKLSNAWDIGFTLGGYIVKDKLWFFVGFNPSQYKTELQRTVSPYDLDANGNPIPIQGGGFQETNVPSATRNYYQTQTNYSYLGKLTWLINSDNRLSFSIAGTPDSYVTPYGNGPNGDYTSSSFSGVDQTLDMVLRLNSSFMEKKLLLDVTLGYHHQSNNQLPIDGSTLGQTTGDVTIPDVIWTGSYNLTQNFPNDPASNSTALQAVCNGPNGATACSVGGYSQGGGGPGGVPREVTEERVQGKLVLTYFLNALGHQTWKAGADVEWFSYNNKIGDVGTDIYFAYGGSPQNSTAAAFLDYRAQGYLVSPDNPVYVPVQNQISYALMPGYFLQDSWNIMDKVTVNIGVRDDNQYFYDTTGALALALNNQWSPRVGVIWDPTYQGKSKIYASYAFYYEQVPLDLVDRDISGNETLSAYHYNCNNPAVTGQRCPNAAGNFPGGGSGVGGGLGLGAGPNQYWFAIGAPPGVQIDPNIVPDKSDEIQIGAEYEIFPNARLGVNYTHRGLSRLIEDFSQNSASSYLLGNPGFGIASNFVQPARIYNGYTVSLTKTFADHWQAQVSYTYISLNGNYDGLFSANYQGQLDPNITAAYDLPQFLVNAFGPLQADTQNSIKAFGSYQFVFAPTVGLTLGLAYLGHSGAPISALGGDLLYGADAVYLIPRGTYGRLPWVNDLDIHATVDIGLGGDMKLSVGLDVFNILGLQSPIQVDQSWVFPTNTPVKAEVGATPAQLKANPLVNPATGQAYPNPQPLNPNFGHATQYQAARTFRFLARFTF